MRVLVIEDDDSVRGAVRRALLLGGYEVLAAPTGQEGLLKAETDVPDAIVLDLGLPDIDEMEVGSSTDPRPADGAVRERASGHSERAPSVLDPAHGVEIGRP
jgi:two-component system, OmpR family, KDP operon response regulator KdpE